MIMHLPIDKQMLHETLAERSLFDNELVVTIMGQTGPGGSPAKGEAPSWEALADELPERHEGIRLAIAIAGTVPAGNVLLEAVRRAEGEVLFVAPLKPKDVPSWVGSEADKRGLRLPADVIAAIAATSRNNLQLIQNELDKLAAFAATDRLTRRTVDRLIVGGEESAVWKMADAIAQRSPKRLLAEYALAKQDGRPAPYIISALAGSLLDAAVVGAGLADGSTLHTVAAAAKMPAWRVEKLARTARSATMPRLAAWLDALFALDADIKSGRIDGEVGLDRLVLEMAGTLETAGR